LNVNENSGFQLLDLLQLGTEKADKPVGVIKGQRGVEKAANEFNTRSQKKPPKETEDESQIRGHDCPEHPGE
jgi:hypothetical protein